MKNLHNCDLSNTSDFHDAELLAHSGETDLHFLSQLLIREVRRLRHALEDPNYIYCQGRATRDAIMSRNATIKQLQDEIKGLKK